MTSTFLYGGNVHANDIRQHYLRYGGTKGERAQRDRHEHATARVQVVPVIREARDPPARRTERLSERPLTYTNRRAMLSPRSVRGRY